MMNSKKLLPIFLIPILCLFTYQAIKNSIAAVQLNNAQYLLKQLPQVFSNKELDNSEQQASGKNLLIKAQEVLTHVEKLTPNDPEYHNLSANLNLWEALINQDDDKLVEAKKHYVLALQDQPNNAYLWSGLAKTDHSIPKQAYSLKAMALASYYAPSDRVIMKHALFWKLPLWEQLNDKQQKETINQLILFASNKRTSQKTRQQLKKIITDTGQKNIICSRLPKTKQLKTLCK